MKTKFIFAALVMGVAAVACSPKAEEAPAEEGAVAQKTAKDYVPAKATVDSVSYLVGINFGSFVKGYDFGELNFAQIKKGMQDFINAKGNMQDPEFAAQFKISPEAMNELFNSYLENRHNYKLLVNKEKEAAFLKENLKKEGMVQTPSGLQYRIVEEGGNVKPAATDTVWVLYKGTLLDGTVFDQTKEGAEPVQMTLNHVIAGWTEGLQLIGEGGKIELTIPAALAYGERGTQGIEPNSTLQFTVEVKKIGKVAAE